MSESNDETISFLPLKRSELLLLEILPLALDSECETDEHRFGTNPSGFCMFEREVDEFVTEMIGMGLPFEEICVLFFFTKFELLSA